MVQFQSGHGRDMLGRPAYSRLHLRACTAMVMILALTLSVPCAIAYAEKSPYDWAHIRLDYVRQEKARHLRHFCDRVHALALQASKDESVISFFHMNLEYSRVLAQGSAPEDLAATLAELREGFNRYYIENYLLFYDFLFVDMQGKVFYTLRKEEDINTYLGQGATEDNALAQCKSDSSVGEVFIDFHEYGPSSEPAAFFVEPVQKDGVQIGRIVLQCAINKVNTLFALTEDLGKTGETFLVNQDGYMLTESSFEGASTILDKRLDDRNIKAKFAEGTGHRTVTDYRGFTALSSFEVVSFLGTRWLVVAKMDKDEVCTEEYGRHRKYYAHRLIEYLNDAEPPPFRDSQSIAGQRVRRVDMDEFLKAESGEVLETFGVSTCTGLVGANPGRFGYLAHISPRDKVYGSDDTNLVGQMVMKIKNFDIYPSEIQDVVFIVVATHLESLINIIDKLTEEGILLSQIHVMYNKQAAAATVLYDYQENALAVTWRTSGSQGGKQTQSIEDAVNMGDVIERLMAAEQGGFRAAENSTAAGTIEVEKH